ncbi:hypothetical protein GGI11_005139, partial [Coemansia sp. RSA 2049]
MGGRQRTTGTLKAFVRVSKNSDGATVDGKRLGAAAVSNGGGGEAKAAGDGASPRMATRSSRISSSNSSSAAIASPAATAPVRKRKSVDVAQQRPAVTPKRVATGSAVAARMATPTASPAASAAKAGRKRNTTIGAYFPATSAPGTGAVKSAAAVSHGSGSGSDECLKRQPEPSSSVSVPSSISAVEQTEADNASSEPQPATADAPEKSESGQIAAEETSGRKESRLRARTTALLERLRGRKRPTTGDDAGGNTGGDGDAGAASETRSSATREIQERIRELREAPSAEEPSADQQSQPHDGASFQAARVRTAADAQLSELRRQFVRIDAPRHAAALSSELRKLEELFQGLEHVTLFGGTTNASAGVVYHKVRRSVEAMARRTFG